MKRLYSFFFISMAFLTVSACGGRAVKAQLDDIESYIQERPDSALSVIRAIDTTTLKTRTLRAQYSLLHAIALDKNWIDTTDADVVMPAVEYYSRHPSDIRRAKAWYYYGRIQENKGDIPGASISFLKAERYSEPFQDHVFKSLVYQGLSNLYSKSHIPDEALRYTELSYQLSVQANDTVGANASLYCKLVNLNNLGRFIESDSLYHILINDSQLNAKFRPSLMCNYALNLVTRHEDFEQAVKIFEDVLSFNGSLDEYNYWGAYAYALTRTGDYKHASHLFQQMEPMRNSASNSYIYAEWKSMADAYLGNYPTAYQLQKEASDIQEENVKKVLKQSTLKAQKEYIEEMNRESEKSAKHRQIIIWCSSATLLIIILLLLILFRRRKARDEQEKEKLLEACKELTEQYIELEREKASVRSQYLQMCKLNFEQIGRINEILNYHYKESGNSLYSELKKTFIHLGEDQKSQSEFERMLDESFNNVMNCFREDFPDRKPIHYQFTSYVFAGFGAATICSILKDFNKRKVYVEKHRLKQMIEESDSPHKDLFLQMLA